VAMSDKLTNYLAAASVLVAFGGLFFGRLLMYPVSTAPGGFLDRLAAESAAWNSGHRVMLLGPVFLIPATLGMRRALRQRAPWLVDVGTTLVIAGAALTVGQFALDFAMLAAAHVEPREAGQQFVDGLRGQPFVEWAFYKLPDISQIGLILFTIALWKQGSEWRVQAALVTLAALVQLSGAWLGPIGIRVALGIMFVAFASVAWKIAAGPALPHEPARI
jgi:hypothetical protein